MDRHSCLLVDLFMGRAAGDLTSAVYRVTGLTKANRDAVIAVPSILPRQLGRVSGETPVISIGHASLSEGVRRHRAMTVKGIHRARFRDDFFTRKSPLGHLGPPNPLKSSRGPSR
tara:strand:- start:626 stop:970 length:345 start_codon:yes stop_codon:yes gene_type:complete